MRVPMVALRVLVVWFAILCLAVLNAALREMVLVPWLGTVPAQILSGLLLSTGIFLTGWLLLPWLGLKGDRQRIIAGLAWLGLTLAFEFSLGRLQGLSWPEMLAAYQFRDGNLLSLILLVTAVTPWAAGRLRGATGGA